MTHDPVSLDTRRTPGDRLAIEGRRRPANITSSPGSRRHRKGPDDETQPATGAGPDRAQTTERARVLLHRTVATRQGQDAGIRRLIVRALSDLTRPGDHEEPRR